MLETRAIVVRLEGEEAIVEAVQSGGCGACGGGGCSSSAMSQMFCVKPRQFRARNGIGARPGEEVQVAVAEGALLRSALILYALPIALLFGGAMAGSSLAGSPASDAGAAAGAVAGLAAGFALARFIISRRRTRAESFPAIIRCDSAGK